MDFIAGWFHHLYETTGLNFTVFYDPYDWHRYLGGLATTVLLCVVTIFLSLVIGAVGALLQSAPSRLAHNAVHVFVVVFRNTPPLVQLFFFYFGIGAILPATQGADGMRLPVIGNLQWAIISLSLFAGAFNVEIFRSGINAVKQGQRTAGLALGMTRAKVFRHIVMPQALRVVLPPIGNQMIGMLKLSALVSVIAVQELLLVADQTASANFRYLEALSAAGIYYLALTTLFMLVQSWLERTLDPKRRAQTKRLSMTERLLGVSQPVVR